ncbi:hypothetical protein ACIRF8_30965 [Streptomyces sp. NPDC102406]|uniref:hypothetical protein n=1 Tax=Streptomyces sp. NPDC102406 TaxID=3366171 RepID=UPI003821B467
MAQPHQPAPTIQAATPAAPAPTGLAYTYDTTTQTVTVTWDPKAPTDTITRSYSPGSCGPTPAYPCFIAVSYVLTANTWTFKKTPGAEPTYFRLYAQNEAHRYAGSEILVITV